MIRFFLERPIFAGVCSALILLAGAVVIPILPIAQFPQIAPPVVTVTTTWTGASSQELESSVTTPLEEAINGVEGLRYITSTSTSAGITTITCTFDLGTSLDIAATDVQNAVGTATPLLPTAVQQTGVLVTKNSGAFVLAYGFSSSNPQFDSLYLSNYVDLNIVDSLKRISGVSNVMVFGERKYAMRLWIDPKRLSDYGLTADDVVNALNTQNVAVAAGAIGGAPVADSQPFQLNIRAVGRLTTPKQFDDLILSTLPNGGYVRFSDVGRVDLGAQDYSQTVRFDGHPAVAIGIQAFPTANALDVAKAVRAAMADFQKDFPPGVSAKIAFDSTEFVTESLREVIITLGISIVLVVLVIFIFLQNARTTIVPVITIPISLIGTFAIMQVLGFSINTLTLFGLTLATGLVVDDAIVVIENIARFIQEEKMSPLQGAAAAMDEISGAVIASSLVLLAVFVPVAFFPGTTGQLYRQFALTIAGSITISLIVALTLTPVLSRLFLSASEEHHNRFFDPVNRVIDATRGLYGRLLPILVRGRMFVMAAYVVGVAATVFMNHITPTGFLPDEDQGYFFAQGETADKASLPYTAAQSAKVGSLIASFPEVADVLEASGQDFISSGANRALYFANLKPWAQRGGAQHSLSGILQRLQPQLSALPGIQAVAFNPPAIQGFANVAGFQFELEDRTNSGLGALDQTSKQLLGAANANPNLSSVYDTFSNDAPQLVVDVDREKVQSLGIPLQSVFDAMEISLGSLFVNQFDFLNRSYRVYVQADAPFRSRLDAFDSIYVHAPALTPGGPIGASVPLSTLVHVSTEKAAPIISHYNLFRSVEINGSPAAGKGSGEALAAMQQTAERILPHGMSFEWSGLSLEQLASGAQGALVFALGIVVVFLVLAAKYESLTDPLTILLAVPLAILGALLALGARHFVSDVYAQVGFVMLIGLASKNAILIVEFANQLRGRGRDIVTAAIEAAETRFRPIVMTSLAFICAILPLLVASGAGSISRQSLGTTLFGGMLFASALNLTLVPVLYVVIVQLRERFGSRRKSNERTEHLDAQPIIRRGKDGEVILAFANGGKPLELRVDASPMPEDKE
jgi:hydrophobic/amphiphilic exporter-1 (mainly G- bacteria), HAE1 family